VHTQLGEERVYDAVGLGEKSLEKMLGLCILVVDSFGASLGSEYGFLAALSELLISMNFRSLMRYYLLHTTPRWANLCQII